MMSYSSMVQREDESEDAALWIWGGRGDRREGMMGGSEKGDPRREIKR